MTGSQEYWLSQINRAAELERVLKMLDAGLFCDDVPDSAAPTVTIENPEATSNTIFINVATTSGVPTYRFIPNAMSPKRALTEDDKALHRAIQAVRRPACGFRQMGAYPWMAD